MKKSEKQVADLINATTQIAPVVEEIMKLLPLLFYLLIFEPKSEKINIAVLIVAATFYHCNSD